MTVRFGLLGTGYWARVTHAPGIVASAGADLVGVWGRDPAKAAAVADEHGARVYTDAGELIADVDAVAIAVPPHVQAELALRAADAGRHLLLDKPVALSTRDADRLLAVAERNRLASVVFFTARFLPEVRRWYADVEGTDWDTADVRLLANIYHDGNPYAESAWRREHGALWDIGPHALAAVLPVLGPVARVAAGRGRGDMVHMVLEHESGASSTMTLSLTAPDAARQWQVNLSGGAGQTSMPTAQTSFVDGFAVAVSDLARAIQAGDTSHPCGLHFGRDVVSVLEKVAAQLS